MDIKELEKIIEEVEIQIQPEFKKYEEQALKNSEEILEAFNEFKISETDLHGTTGYGYNDIGREKIDKIFAKILGTELAIARSHFISGTHALTVAHFGILRPNDIMLAISGLPYDSLQKVIGIIENNSSLKSFGIKYEQIDLINNMFDECKIIDRIKKQDIKLVTIQKSRGYSTRNTLFNEEINNIIKKIRQAEKEIKLINPNYIPVIILVDNCYSELVENVKIEGADLLVGSLIKNLGGAIATNGGYIAGREELIELCAERLTCPGQGREVGPTLESNRNLLQGIYHAPQVVLASLKCAIFTSCILEKLGYDVNPKYNEKRGDIVQNIIFNDEEKMVKYIQGIQQGSAIDSYVLPIASDMPGYKDKVIMASGSFISGSSIELSCDGPLRPPYIAYQQGAVTYEYGKIGVIKAIKNLLNI